MEQVKLVLTVISTFGLGSILVVIVGRLWTVAYFEYFGLPSGDLEFSIDDFAFRSLEVLISLGLGGLGLLVAWRAREVFKAAGPRSLALEVALVGGAVAFMFCGLGRCLDRAPLLAQPGILGVISGAALFVMIVLIADVWFGPEKGQKPPSVGGIKIVRAVIANRRKLLAGGMMVLVVFLYLPVVTGRLARIKAETDLREGHPPVAILESVEGPLPSAIASDADDKKSIAVRVILAQSQNTYVLNSTQCKAIGELDVKRTEEGVTFTTHPDVCKVFAIPTSRLKSIEYRSLTGSPPPNDTPFLAEALDLSEPLDATVSTIGASDDEEIDCENGQEGVSFYNTVWYKLTPDDPGTILANATSLKRDLEPIVAVWEGSEEGVLQPEAAWGSGLRGRACEARAVLLPRWMSSAPGVAQRVATIANLEADKTYFVVIGAQGDQEGEIQVHIEFMSDGFFFYNPKKQKDMSPKVEVESINDRVELEFRELDKTTYYEWKAPADDLGEFYLAPEEGEKASFKDSQADQERTLLAVQRGLDPGTWTLEVPDDFVGHVRLTLTRAVIEPDLVLAFAGTSAPPLEDIRVQAALLLVIDPAQIREELGLEGFVIFDPESHDSDALTFEAGEDAMSAARELLGQAGIAPKDLQELHVQIQVYPQTKKERELLLQAASILRKQLGALGLRVTIDQDQCEDICICVFFQTRPCGRSAASSGNSTGGSSTP